MGLTHCYKTTVFFTFIAILMVCCCVVLMWRLSVNFGLYRSGSALSQLYGTEATLEHHHFNHAVMILNSEVCDRHVLLLFNAMLLLCVST